MLLGENAGLVPAPERRTVWGRRRPVSGPVSDLEAAPESRRKGAAHCACGGRSPLCLCPCHSRPEPCLPAVGIWAGGPRSLLLLARFPEILRWRLPEEPWTTSPFRVPTFLVMSSGEMDKYGRPFPFSNYKMNTCLLGAGGGFINLEKYEEGCRLPLSLYGSGVHPFRLLLHQE